MRGEEARAPPRASEPIPFVGGQRIVLGSGRTLGADSSHCLSPLEEGPSLGADARCDWSRRRWRKDRREVLRGFSGCAWVIGLGFGLARARSYRKRAPPLAEPRGMPMMKWLDAPPSTPAPSASPPAFRPHEVRAVLHALRGETPRLEVLEAVPRSMTRHVANPFPSFTTVLRNPWPEGEQEPPGSNGPPAMRPQTLRLCSQSSRI